MQKKMISITPEEISFECIGKDTVYKDDRLSDHIVAWHTNALLKKEEKTIADVIHSSNPTPLESCNNCLSCDQSDVFRDSYASALEYMLELKQKYGEISYNKMHDQFITDLQQFQKKIEKPNVIHIYDRKIVNNSYLEPPEGILDKYSYYKFNLMSNEKISVDVFIPKHKTAITKYHSHHSTRATTITFQCYETSFSIPKLQTS